jgi:hypothetical protein
MMTVESERGTSDGGVDTESTPTPRDTPDTSTDSPYNGDQYEAQGNDSPELLRTRADSLLDEMMLGAVDVSAADRSTEHTEYGVSQYDTSERSSSEFGSADDAVSGYSSSDFASPEFTPADDALDDYAFRDDPSESTVDSVDRRSRDQDADDLPTYEGGWHTDPDQNGLNGSGYSYTSGSNTSGFDTVGRTNGGTSSTNGHRDMSWSEDSRDGSFDYGGSYASESSRTNTSSSSAELPDAGANRTSPVPQRQNGHTAEADETPTPTPEWRVKTGGGTDTESGAWKDYVSSFRSPEATDGTYTTQIQKWQPHSPADGYGSSTASEESSSSSASVTGASGVANEHSPPAGHASEDETSQSSSVNAGGSADRDDSVGLGYVSAMSVMPKGPRRSSLLPRMSRFDVDALNREIAELHEEIRELLPVGHDQAERAQHLLDKAHTIADSDPERSAEVEYYMQQVRSIVDRTRQSRSWSNVYRDRLRTYLLAWALLGVMTLAALLMSQFQMEAFMAGVLDAARDGVFLRNFAGALGALMAGALGGALGALINMGKHARSQYGFFDRKYGLRGLMLPIIGALVGIVVYSLFGIVYHFAGINPSLSAAAMAVPAILAFVFGFSQESVYGTSG